MKMWQKFLAALIAVVVAGIGYVLYTDMQSNTPNTTLWVAVLTTFGVVLTAVVTQLFTKQRELEEVLLWGDRDMVRWWDSFGDMDEDAEPRKVLMDVDRLISMMRDELGVDNAGIEPGDLFSVYLAADAKRLLKGAG